MLEQQENNPKNQISDLKNLNTQAQPTHDMVPAKNKNKLAIVIGVIVLLVILGVGGWWYYAYGQAMMLIKDSSWSWANNGIESYKGQASSDLNIKTTEGNQNSDLMSFLGADTNISMSSSQTYMGADMEGETSISISDNNKFDFQINIESKKLDNNIYFKTDWSKLEDVLLGFVDLSSLSNDTWLEIPLDFVQSLSGQSSEDVKIDNQKIEQANQIVDDYFQKLKQAKIFKIKDAHQTVVSSSGDLKKIQLVFVPDKLPKLAQLYFEFMSDMDQSFKNNISQEDRDKMIEGFKNKIEIMKNEKPDQWENIKNNFEKTSIFILVNSKTKNISGWEVYFEDINTSYKSSSTSLGGNFKYLMDVVDPYPIVKPQTIYGIDQLMSKLSPLGLGGGLKGTLVDTDNDGLDDYSESLFGTDPNNPDTDGDGYLDGEEVNNGYNPLGEGELTNVPTSDNYQIDYDLETMCGVTGGSWEDNTCI